MKDLKVGDKVLVPMEVISKQDGDDFPYMLGYDTARINASEKMIERFQKAACAEDSGKTYEDGQADAWKTAGKLFNMSTNELDDIFGKNKWDIYEIMERPPQEVAEKIAEQEIHVGDLIYTETGYGGVVTNVHRGNCYVLWADGSSGCRDKKNFTKTGRTIDIAGLLSQIGGTEDA